MKIRLLEVQIDLLVQLQLYHQKMAEPLNRMAEMEKVVGLGTHYQERELKHRQWVEIIDFIIQEVSD